MPTKNKSQLNLEFDSPWKEIIEEYFPAFMEFFQPELAKQIDWQQQPEFLDQELSKIVREAVTQTRRVDKLVKVYLINGTSTLLYLHLEIQGQVDPDFESRMYIYHYRLYDRYGGSIMSLAILGDPKRDWRPCHYHYDHFGCRLHFEFPIIKLLDYQAKLAEIPIHSP